jgi:hypothetical protein
MERFPSCFALEQFLRGATRGRKSGRLTSAITGVRPVGRVLGNPVHPCAWGFPVFKQSRVVRQDCGLLVNNLHESPGDCFFTLFYAGRVVFQLEFRLSADCVEKLDVGEILHRPGNWAESKSRGAARIFCVSSSLLLPFKRSLESFRVQRDATISPFVVGSERLLTKGIRLAHRSDLVDGADRVLISS